MSNERFRALLAQMETWLGDPAWDPEAEDLDRWNAEFLEALAQADKGPGWADLAARAHAAGRRMEALEGALSQELERVRKELEAQDRGRRALKGYGAGTR